MRKLVNNKSLFRNVAQAHAGANSTDPAHKIRHFKDSDKSSQRPRVIRSSQCSVYSRFCAADLTLIPSLDSTADLEELVSGARDLKISFVRATVFGPDANTETSLGSTGLRLMSAAAHQRGLYLVSEVLETRYLKLMQEFCDVLEITPRNFGDEGLLRAVGETDKTVIIYRNPRHSVSEFLKAVEIVERAGQAKIVIGDKGSYYPFAESLAELDLSSLLSIREQTPYPLIVDVRGIAKRSLQVEVLAQAALVVGVDGLVLGFGRRGKNISMEMLRSLKQKLDAIRFTFQAMNHIGREAVNK
ncbi:hypothetical protein JNK13_11010 [bacterium]|nr:hypothetical protein [bacterium]